MRSIVPASWLAFLLLLLAVADLALADESFILATGRRDPRIYTIDFNAALKPRNNNTPNAIVSRDRKSTRLNSSHSQISYAVFCLKKKKHPSTNNWKNDIKMT